MRNGVTAELDLDKILLGLLGALADALGHFLGLAVTDTDLALLVTDDDECSEAEATTALHDLGTTVDMNNLLDVFWGLFGLVSRGK